MSSIILPRRWQRQPSGQFEIDWRNELTRELAHCYVGGDGYHVNRVTGQHTGTLTGRMGTEARPDSRATAGTGSAYMEDSLNAPTTLPLSIGVVAGARPNGNGQIFGSSTGGSVGSAVAAVGTGFIGNAYPQYQIDLDSGVIISDTDARSSLVNTDRAYVCRSNSATDHALIVGRRKTTNTTTRNVVVAGAQIGLGRVVRTNFSATNLATTAWFSLACMWFRGLDDAEAFEFNAAPWQLFRPRRQVLYFDAGGGGYNLLADTGSFALTGSTAGLITARSVVTDSGSFVVTCNSTDLVRAQRITVDPGSLVLVGSDATLTHTTVGAFTLTADSGSFALTGNAAGLTIARSVTTDTGSFALTGNAATLTKTTVGAYTLGADLGVFTFDGQQTSLLYSRRAITATGSFALTGTDTALTQGYTLAGAAGSFVLDGYSANLRADRSLAALVDTFTLVGVAATLTKTTAGAFELPASAGVFAVAGNSAGLVYTPNNNYALTCDAGTFSAAGVETSLRTQYRLAGVTAGFTVTGVANQTTVARRVGAAVGAYALLGTAATLRGPTRLYADTAAFVFTGRSAVLAYSGYDPLEQEKYDRGVRVYHETTKGVRVSQSATDVRHKTSEVNLHVVN